MLKRICCVVVLVGLAVMASAQNTIVYFNGPSFQVPAFEGSQSLDVNNDGTPDFVFGSSGPMCTADIPSSMCVWSFNVIHSVLSNAA